MVQKFMESLLPGVRHLRAPLIGGLVWVIVGWVLALQYREILEPIWTLIGDSVETAAAYFGPTVVVPVVAVFVFAVGAAMEVFSDLLVRGLGRFLRWVSARRELARFMKSSARAVSTALGRASSSLAAHQAQTEPAGQARAAAHLREREGLERRLHNAKSLSAKLTRHGLLLYRMRPRSQHPLKEIEQVTQREKVEDDTARALVQRLAHSVYDAAEFAAIMSAPELPVEEVTREHDSASMYAWQLHQELTEGDPLVVLRAVSLELFNDMDRRRAEREVRIAFAVPMVALTIILSVVAQQPWLLAAVIVPLGPLRRYALEADNEVKEVILALRTLASRPPTLELCRQKAEIETRTRIASQLGKERDTTTPKGVATASV